MNDTKYYLLTLREGIFTKETSQAKNFEEFFPFNFREPTCNLI